MTKGTDYSTYLRINDLLTLQVPLSEGAPDELLFIVVHQSYELWFKVIIDELRRGASFLHAHEPWRALAPLRRTVEIEDLLMRHLRVLETMSPEGFLAFRDPLDPASGFQSVQFRAIEFLSGGGDVAALSYDFFDDAQRAWLGDISTAPSLWSGFVSALRFDAGASAGDDVVELIRALYHDHEAVGACTLHAVAELLMDHDENLASWRHRHMMLAGREIGRRPGTGGSAGMSYLDTTLDQRLYPVLWEVRSLL